MYRVSDQVSNDYLPNERLTILQIDIRTNTHLRSDRLKDQPLLPPRRIREFNLPIQPSGPQQRRIQSIGSIRRHDDLDVGTLIKSVHLSQEFD